MTPTSRGGGASRRNIIALAACNTLVTAADAKNAELRGTAEGSHSQNCRAAAALLVGALLAFWARENGFGLRFLSRL